MFLNDAGPIQSITEVTEVRFQPNLLTATPDEDQAAAHSRARDAGKTF